MLQRLESSDRDGRLALPKRFKSSPTVNVERLKPYYARTGRRSSPGPVADPGQEGKYEVEQILNRKTIRGRTHYLVQWKGQSSADDSWEPVEHLTTMPVRTMPVRDIRNFECCAR